MARQSKTKFTMKGHTLPGINQKSETANIKDGRSPSSAFQQNSPVKNYKDTTKYKAFEGGNKAGSAFQQKIANTNQVAGEKIQYGNPNAMSTEKNLGWRGYVKKYHKDGTDNTFNNNPIGGVITKAEEKWYKDNPYSSPTADEQDIFMGKDIEATNNQYTKGSDGKLYIGSVDNGKAATRDEDLSGNHDNDKIYINRGKRLEREKAARNQTALTMKSPLAQMTYTCPECGDEFETLNQMGNHLQSAHLGGGSGSPGAGRNRDQTSGLDSEGDNRPTRNTNPSY